jgi:hypothetical protein
MENNLKISIAVVLIIVFLLILYLAHKKDLLILNRYHKHIDCCHHHNPDEEVCKDMENHKLDPKNPEHLEHYKSKILYNKLSEEKSSLKKLSINSVENGIRGSLFGAVTGMASAMSGAVLFATIPTAIAWGREMAEPYDLLV